jgi:hypothetical protein
MTLTPFGALTVGSATSLLGHNVAQVRAEMGGPRAFRGFRGRFGRISPVPQANRLIIPLITNL